MRAQDEVKGVLKTHGNTLRVRIRANAVFDLCLKGNLPCKESTVESAFKSHLLKESARADLLDNLPKV